MRKILSLSETCRFFDPFMVIDARDYLPWSSVKCFQGDSDWAAAAFLRGAGADRAMFKKRRVERQRSECSNEDGCE